MKHKGYSFRRFFRKYALIMALLFLASMLLYGAVSYAYSKKRMETSLEYNLSHASVYLNNFLNSMAYNSYTLAADPTIAAVMNSPLTVDPYMLVKAQQLCDHLQSRAAAYGCTSIYLYLDEADLVFATGMGKLASADFGDGEFLQGLSEMQTPALVERDTLGVRTLTLVTRYPSGASNRRSGYICYNIRYRHLTDQFSGMLRENYRFSLGSRGREPTVHLSFGDAGVGADDFALSKQLDAYGLQVTASYSQKQFRRDFFSDYLRTALFLFLLVLMSSVVLLWGLFSLFGLFRPAIYKLADLYRQSDSQRDLTLDDLKKSFDQLITDRQSYSDQLHDMQLTVKEKLFTDLLMGNVTGEAEFVQLCGDIGIDCRYDSFLVACVQIFGRKSELTTEEKVFSRVLIKNVLSNKGSGDMLLHVMDGNDDNVGVLLSSAAHSETEILNSFLDTVSQISKSLESNESIKFFVTVTFPVKRMLDIPQAYRRAKANQIYRYIATHSTYMVSNMSERDPNTLLSQMDINRVVSATNGGRLDLVCGYVREMVVHCDTASAEEWHELKSKVLIISGTMLNQIFLSARRDIWQPLFDKTNDILNATDGPDLLSRFHDVTDIIDKERITSLVESESGSQYVRQAYQFIDANFERNFSVSDIADYLSVNVKYLSRLFKQESGKTMTQYISELRLEKAVMLLEQNELPIQEIGIRVGFNDVRGFVRLFKKSYGKTPKEYREDRIRSANE